MPRIIDAAQTKGISKAFLDRLTLNDARIDAMIEGLKTIAELPDPVGTMIAEWDRPNGLHIERVRTPLGVIGVIFESRPNVTADAGALCIKSGNAVILRGGSDSFHSSHAIVECLLDGLHLAGLPVDAIQLVPTTDRAAVGEMLQGPRRQYRRHRAARRQDPGRPRPGRSPRAGLRPSRRPRATSISTSPPTSTMAVDRHPQRQDAPHRRLRRRRDPAGPQGRGRHPSQAHHRRADRQGLRNPRRRHCHGD